MIRFVLCTTMWLAAIGATATAQDRSLAGRVLDREGVVRFAFTPREDVCGDGRGMIRFRDHESWIHNSDDGRRASGRGSRWYTRRCVDGPGRVALTVRDGRVARARVYVGGDWDPDPDATDLGMISTVSAAATLLDLARRSDSRASDDLVLPAILVDSVTVWPQLLDLARDERAPRNGRKSAVFWLSQAAGDRVSEDLGDFVADDEMDREVREHAVFALSQLRDDQGVPVLLRVARENPDPKIRRKALFWLGQSEDPRALALFEEILTRPR